MEADALLAHYAKTVPPLSRDWQGISQWTAKRARLEATEAALLAQNRRGGSPEVWAQLGRIYTEVGELGRGLWFLCKALEAHPDDVESWVILGNNRLASREPEEALALFARALELNPDHTFAWARSGEAHLDLGDEARAREDFEQALLLSPRNLVARMGLARLLEDSGDLEGARTHLERALREDEDDPVALFRLARVLGKLGLEEEAAEVEVRHERAAILEDKRLREANVPAAEKYLAVGETFLGDGRIADARRELERARELARTDEHRVRALAGLLSCARSGQSSLDAGALESELRALAPDHPLLAR
jgi:tetratricopeptide (TPR) repeat protein